jgi:hypothetical protein
MDLDDEVAASVEVFFAPTGFAWRCGSGEAIGWLKQYCLGAFERRMRRPA